MQEAKKSKFQFANPRITKIDFKANGQFDKDKYNGIGAKFESNIYNREEYSADVDLKVSLGMNADSVPFQLEALISCEFRWGEDIPDCEVDRVLNVSAKIMLLSYLRPFIAHLIVDAGFPPLVLPFFDFSDEGNEDDDNVTRVENKKQQ